MKVPYVEDLANHSSPESCGGYSNGPAEALTGESVGELLSSGITTIWVPTPCSEGEGHADGSDICELSNDLAESKNLACVDASGTEGRCVQMYTKSGAAQGTFVIEETCKG